ncbi:MAG: NUDIX domain-containing protein [Methylococcus sp.]
MGKAFEIMDESPLYRGFFNLTRYRLRHTLYAGGWCEPLVRELFHRGRCVAVLPYDPETDRVILIEQFRIGAVGDKETPWLVEIVAGAIEPGEEPEAVARREAEEEAGCRLGELIHIGDFYTTPGGCSEKVSVFCGLLDGPIEEGVFGLSEEGEDIRAMALSADEALAWLAAGLIDSAIPALALQWLALNRGRLGRNPG